MTAPPSIAPIPTFYKGYHFRSRLEARWAVFFDALGLSWEYEPEGFDIDGTWYLPDFRVQAGDITFWYEVKPRTTVVDEKFALFTRAVSVSDCLLPARAKVETRLLSGDPLDVFGPGLSMGDICPRCGKKSEIFIEWGRNRVSTYCEPCDFATPCGGDNDPTTGFSGLDYVPRKGDIEMTFGDYCLLLKNLHAACHAARSARFEHGQSGPT